MNTLGNLESITIGSGWQDRNHHRGGMLALHGQNNLSSYFDLAGNSSHNPAVVIAETPKRERFTFRCLGYKWRQEMSEVDRDLNLKGALFPELRSISYGTSPIRSSAFIRRELEPLPSSSRGFETELATTRLESERIQPHKAGLKSKVASFSLSWVNYESL